MIKKIIFLFIFLVLLLFSIQSQKYKYQIVDGKYKIDDLNEFLSVFKKALKDKDNDTILKLCVEDIAYDDENFTGSMSSNKDILETGFSYDLCLKMLNYKPETDKTQVWIPGYKRNVNEDYTIIIDKRPDIGWLFMGLYLVPYEYIPESKEMIKTMYTPTIDNLRFRETPTLDGKFIRMLNKGEQLELIEKGKEETISGTKGTWVKVKTEKGEVGWCFDAYLEEVKKK